MSLSVSIKGTGQGLVLSVPAGEWTEIRRAVVQAIDERADFFRSARLALQVDAHELGAAELGGLRDELARRDVGLWAVLSTSPITKSAAADLGLALELEKPDAPADEQPLDTLIDGEEAVLVIRTLHSGNVLRNPGHVIVMGDVNPGAEIAAGGNVIVWGRLRGVVHAGAGGDEAAVVCALDLAPTQLRIAGQIAVSPERRKYPGPEIARIRDGQLIAETWTDGRQR
ncbi:MAG: septum site-determining protein MinC [Chloroflexi bacterium RBG_19FT_COMBO_62_14]|nr:MAG: septum site-determining protein MinC [Chloroflexi bacterium RBG_19FT_COMBO_62_14]